MGRIVLYASGSPILVDVVETCRRLGLQVAALIRNVGGPDFAGDAAPVVPLADAPASLLASPIAIPLFTPANRHRAWREAESRGARDFPSLLDPTAVLASDLRAEDGAYVNAGCTIGAASRIGRFAFVNRGACLGHHLDLGAFASVGPGVVAAGQVTVGRGAMVGAGAVIAPGVTIGAHAVVGPGAVVARDVAERTIVLAPPGRIAGTRDAEETSW